MFIDERASYEEVANMDAVRTDWMTRVPYRLTELWKHQKEDNSVYVMDGVDGHIYQLNITAGHLWLLVDGTRTLEAVIAGCLEAFEVDDPDEARTSLLEYVDNLHSCGLLAFVDE
jgi:hypothetical protein